MKNIQLTTLFSLLFSLIIGATGCNDDKKDAITEEDETIIKDGPDKEAIQNTSGILYFDRQYNSWVVTDDTKNDGTFYLLDETYKVGLPEDMRKEVVFNGDVYNSNNPASSVEVLYITITSLDTRIPARGEKAGTVTDVYGHLSYSERFESWIITRSIEGTIDNFHVYLIDEDFPQDTDTRVFFSGDYYYTDAKELIATEMIYFLGLELLMLKY